MKHKILIIGAGAAGVYCAIQLAEKRPDLHICIIEKSNTALHKVFISGGGRCNVTHNTNDPVWLSTNYPNGQKELMPLFYSYNPTHVIEWFAKKGIKLKAESDGRVFPISDNSETIINCFMSELQKHKIDIMYHTSIVEVKQDETKSWIVKLSNGNATKWHALVCCTGSNHAMWQLIEGLGHKIQKPVPSLFTFTCKEIGASGLMGISAPHCTATIKNTSLQTDGPLLITHWGFSGPAILKLSAWGARILASMQYTFILEINWTENLTANQVLDTLQGYKKQYAKKQVDNTVCFALPSRLWIYLLQKANVNTSKRWADCSLTELQRITSVIVSSQFNIKGKSTNKDEFVTSGGVDLKEVNMKRMESKLHSGLYFAGEVLNIDAITGGFNFQAAWTTAWFVSESIANDKLN